MCCNPSKKIEKQMRRKVNLSGKNSDASLFCPFPTALATYKSLQLPSAPARWRCGKHGRPEAGGGGNASFFFRIVPRRIDKRLHFRGWNRSGMDGRIIVGTGHLSIIHVLCLLLVDVLSLSFSDWESTSVCRVVKPHQPQKSLRNLILVLVYSF